MRIFYLEESASQPNKYLIRFNQDQMKCIYCRGSYNIMPARLLNISYANYLRLCRDEFKAIIVGKNTKYPIPYFSKDSAASLINLLNQNAAKVLKEIKNDKNYE